MKLKDFLKNKILGFLLVLFLIFTIETFLLIGQNGIFIHLYVGVSILVTYIIIILLEYIQRKIFYNEIEKNLEKLDKKYLLAEMIKNPSFYEGKKLKEILEETQKAMAEHVNDYKFEQEEYKEYIELWIHEIKTPISVSKMIIENNPSEVTKNLEEEIDKIENFIEQVLFYARSNHTEKDYLIKKTNLKELVHTIIRRNKKELITNKVQIDLHEIEGFVYTDSKWIEFILHQIIGNSIKYKKENSKIEIYSRKEKDKVKLIIKDNGIGIKEDELKRVFNKGFTGSNGRNTNKSTGIGLYLCQKLCQKLRHGIEIESKEDQGTEVIITFPESSFVQLQK